MNSPFQISAKAAMLGALVGVSALASSLAFAKLPPLAPDAKAKADEAAAKLAWSAKQDTYSLCKVQDRVAATYFASAKASGKEVKAPTPPGACADPGPFAYTPVESKPLEVSGAHSPTGTAISPPSTKQVDAVLNPNTKK
jgi:hypothetical protein